MLIKASLSPLLRRSRPLGPFPSAPWVPFSVRPPWRLPPRLDLWLLACNFPCPYPHPVPHSLACQCILLTPALLIGAPGRVSNSSPRHTQTQDHALPQRPHHTYLFPPSLPLPGFCLVTERHLGTLPRLKLASCTVPRNLRQSGRAAGLPGYAWQTTR